MNVWLITTGNSDVQVKNASAWHDWYRAMPKGGLYGNDRKSFTPSRPIDDDGEPYRMAARVLGLAYEALGDVVWEELAFPLLEAFRQKLREQQVAIDEVILLLTDQSSVFEEDDRSSQHCPYWQDTCLLYPMLERYLQAEFPGVRITPLVLHPLAGQPGLDHWNEVLSMVQRQLGELAIDPARVYVSHQAGTPAISSAVQFSSLARFGNRVQFLVSNEYHREPEVLPSSNYLRGIQIEQAKKLIDRYDYTGTLQILKPYLEESSQSEAKRILKLLAAAIDWNFAEFYRFKNKLLKIEGFAEEKFPWWRLGYESAHLSLCRLEEGDTVEALFHSFRGMEGMISRWVECHYRPHILKEGDAGFNPAHGPQIKRSICSVIPGYSKALSQPNQTRFDQYDTIGLYGDPLYELFRLARPEWKDDPHIAVVWKTAKRERNSLFHQIEGLQPEEVFEAWNIDKGTIEKLEKRLLGCLNFIAAKDIPRPFESFKEASLMFKAHRELVKAIARL